MIRKAGDITYTLLTKQVKNINLRVKRDGSVWASANQAVSAETVDEFVARKAEWIVKARRHIAEKNTENSGLTQSECLALFETINDRVYPLFAATLSKKPQIKVKRMKSCWGVCHYDKGYITLNTVLASKPAQAVEYVIMHEYIHFFEHNHQKGFYELMAHFMPDYKERRKLLR